MGGRRLGDPFADAERRQQTHASRVTLNPWHQKPAPNHHTPHLSFINPLISPKCVIVLMVTVFRGCLGRNAITRFAEVGGGGCDSVEGEACLG